MYKRIIVVEILEIIRRHFTGQDISQISLAIGLDHKTIRYPSERLKHYDKFSDKLEKTLKFNRQLVSFQTNKEEPIYHWFKYKEGFSSNLVKYFLTQYSDKPGTVLDPFAGTGTT